MVDDRTETATEERYEELVFKKIRMEVKIET